MWIAIWKSLQIWSGTTAASFWGQAWLPECPLPWLFPSYNCRMSPWSRPKGELVNLWVSPQTEHAESVTHLTATRARDVKGECPWEERMEFHRKACFWPSACQHAFLMLLTACKHDSLGGRQGCPAQKHVGDLGLTLALSQNLRKEAREPAFYKFTQ